MKRDLDQFRLSPRASHFLNSIAANLASTGANITRPVLVITFPLWQEETEGTSQRRYESTSGGPLVRLGIVAAEDARSDIFLNAGDHRIAIRPDDRITALGSSLIDYDQELFLARS